MCTLMLSLPAVSCAQLALPSCKIPAVRHDSKNEDSEDEGNYSAPYTTLRMYKSHQRVKLTLVDCLVLMTATNDVSNAPPNC